MKLHLPVLLRKALLACFAFTFACSGSVSAVDLTLGSNDLLTIDYAVADSIPNLAGGMLQLNGNTILLLSNCGEGDGKTYTLATSVSGLVDAEGNPISMDSTNNAISNYFDANRPGTGFWKDAFLQLVDGSLQLVLHQEQVKDSVELEGVLRSGDEYQYYQSISFVLSSNNGIEERNTELISLSYNGSLKFSGYVNGSPIEVGYTDEVAIELVNNGAVIFEGNHGGGIGGAIQGGRGDVKLNNNGRLFFL